MKATSPFLVVDSKTITVLDLVDEENTYHKEVTISEALKKASEVSMDLVCFAVAGEESNALCKLMDFGRWKYQNEKKKKKENKAKHNEIKEIRFSPIIEDNDINHKLKHAKEFIEDGHEVNFTMRLKKRVNRNLAKARMDAILAKCEDFASVISMKNEADFIFVKLAKKKE